MAKNKSTGPVRQQLSEPRSWIQAGFATPRLLIVGAGLSGIGLAIRLKRSGIDNFTILEESEDVGGTWLKNTYPNAGCDIPSFLYSYSFAPKHDWPRKYARQPEILEYIRDCVARNGLRHRIVFGTKVTEAIFHETTCVWQVTTSDGGCLFADFLVSATGQLNIPKVPAIEGLDRFRGDVFHSARWNHAVPLEGRRVALIGSGASAAQLLPSLAERAARTFVFQRTPNWIQEFRDTRYPSWLPAVLRFFPWAAKGYRLGLFTVLDLRIWLFNYSRLLNKYYRRILWLRMKAVADGATMSEISPSYPPGCKRIILSNDFLQTLARDDVELVTQAIESVSEKAIVTADGRHSVDVVILATGFETARLPSSMRIVGRGGQTMGKGSPHRAKAWYGIMSPGFPNLAFLYGPNTNVGHNSIIFMVECQVRLILRIVRRMIRDRIAQVDAPEVLVEEYDRRLQASLAQTVWSRFCSSWYKDADGTIVANWPSSAFTYWWRTRLARLAALEFSAVPEKCSRPAEMAPP